MAKASTILVATDFSPTSDFAVEYAASHAKLAGAKLLIAHVFDVPSLDEGEGLLHRGLHSADIGSVERRLRAIRPSEAGVPFEHHLLKGDDAAQELLELARAQGADLIVMGTLGRSGLLRALIGSVAERVLRGADCPVVTVRVPQALN